MIHGLIAYGSASGNKPSAANLVHRVLTSFVLSLKFRVEMPLCGSEYANKNSCRFAP